MKAFFVDAEGTVRVISVQLLCRHGHVIVSK
jgi:hypothetical protein